MLKSNFGEGQAHPISVRRLSHRPKEWPISLFCRSCADFNRCGGIATDAGAGDCRIHCCGGKAECQTVCRRNQNFAAQLKEIGGFDLDNTPRTNPLTHPTLCGIATMIFHGKNRAEAAKAEIVAVKLREVVNLRTGKLRYATREALAQALKFDASARLIVTGIEQDRWVELWWSLGHRVRETTLHDLAGLEPSLVTPPNFSLFCDQPRTSDFSAMKRIAIVHSEFLAAGIPCALHPHIRNETDSNAWIKYVAARPEIKSIVYEFTTGAGKLLSIDLHLQHLIRLSETAGRSLNLVIRGDQRLLPSLLPHYREIVYIDTSAFMKTMHRRKAVRTGNARLDWDAVRTPKQASLSTLMQHNIDEVSATVRQFLNPAT